MAGTVMNMLRQVLANSQMKLAAEEETREAAMAGSRGNGASSIRQEESPQALDTEKLASACDWLADHLIEVVDDRSPQEKLAEYYLVQQAIRKQAGVIGDEPQGPHQTTEAEASSIPPMTIPLEGKQPGAGSNQIPSMPATTPGESMDAGESGEATSANLPPDSVQPNEKAFPADVSNSLETNMDDPPGAGSSAPTKIAQNLNRQIAHLVATGQVTKEAGARLLFHKTGGLSGIRAAQQREFFQNKYASAVRSGVPPKFARAMIAKMAEDAINPAKIEAGTEPILQSVDGANSAQMQGSTVGEQTPATRGSDPGRELLSSNVAAINATKKNAKNVKAEMADYLSEPAQSSAHDSVLNLSLDNTSAAGVKIASARALLEKWSSQSPQHRAALHQAIHFVKTAMPPPAGPGMANPGGMTAPMPGAEAPPPVSDGALAAAAQGVTPEELMAAEMLLTQSAAAMPPPGAAPMGAPPMGAPPGPPMGAPPMGAPPMGGVPQV